MSRGAAWCRKEWRWYWRLLGRRKCACPRAVCMPLGEGGPKIEWLERKGKKP